MGRQDLALTAVKGGAAGRAPAAGTGTGLPRAFGAARTRGARPPDLRAVNFARRGFPRVNGTRAAARTPRNPAMTLPPPPAASHRILAFVLAGGEGSRLHPLTAHRCKPAVPFGGSHRLVDFVLSNLVNSGIQAIHLLVQYRPQPLIEHLRLAWSGGGLHGPCIGAVPPRMRDGTACYRGTAEAVAQNIDLIERAQPDVVAVFGADHVYRMDVRQMLRAHLDAGADATVATVPVPLRECHQFGIVETDDAQRITGFREKPAAARPMPGRPGQALASMGNYLFETGVLLAQLRRLQAEGRADFGRDLLPAMVGSHHVLAYDFAGNAVPGREPGEDPVYWRDVGTVDAWFEAHFDTLGPSPRFRMANPRWPIHTGAEPGEPALVEDGQIHRSTVGPGCIVQGAILDHAMLRRSVCAGPGARLEHCIVMDGARIGRDAWVRHAIIDEDNDIPPGERIGHDLALDRQRFHVTPGGVVVVAAGQFPRKPAQPVTHAGRLPAPGDREAGRLELLAA